MQIGSNQIFKPPLYYNIYINKDIQILVVNLNKVLAVPDWGRHDQISEIDLFICLINWF